MRPSPGPPPESSNPGRSKAAGDFAILFSVCLKMFLRPSTRNRFFCLLALFLTLMVFNTTSYTGRIIRSETAKREVLDQRAFDVFFLRARTPREGLLLVRRHGETLAALGAKIVGGAFIYQNVLYLHFPVPSAGNDRSISAGPGDLEPIYQLFELQAARSAFSTDGDTGGVRVRNASIRYGDPPVLGAPGPSSRPRLQADLRDIATMLRGAAHGKRLEISNRLMDRFVATHVTVEPESAADLNPWLTRVKAIVPLNLLHLWRHLGSDNTTDIFDWELQAVFRPDGTLATRPDLLQTPGEPSPEFPYLDTDIYPRYLPVVAEDLVGRGRGGLLGEPLRIDRPLAALLEKLHADGHHLYTREKLFTLQAHVDRINAEIRATHWNFYLTDLAAGLGFPFMMSLFAFVHLKAEFAFLLMFKDRLRQIRLIFWLLPVALMAVVKTATLVGSLLILPRAADGALHLIVPLVLSLAAAAAGFFPLNRWCFRPFDGRRIELYALHRGR